jgi:RimJ/RimL family protein N-acetyltransferase
VPIPLTTERLRIDPLGPRDIEPFVAYRRDPEVARWQSWESDFPLADAQRIFDSGTGYELPGAGGWLQLGVRDRTSGALHGDIGLHLLDDPHQPRTWEFGVTFARASQGNGYAVEALEAAIRMLFVEEGAHRIVAFCDTRNEAVGRLCARLGMRHESRAVYAEYWKGEWTTTDGWALLVGDPTPYR